MDRKLKERLAKLTPDELERRFRYLHKKHGLADPKPLHGSAPPEVTLDETEEYRALEEMLGHAAKGDENCG